MEDKIAYITQSDIQEDGKIMIESMAQVAQINANMKATQHITNIILLKEYFMTVIYLDYIELQIYILSLHLEEV